MNKVPATKGAPTMKRIIRVTAVITLGLLATACDKCGNWNINTPQFCHADKPQS
ncbi:hypothetical protein [Microvirga calopogonii]|uniref:hypothetical protein n=1 Tax=Microvirga calopogonii TaxID=2078013 RepID=UPI0013B45975|nr:hypothetical protein [Microvirga calopogonii]